MASAYSKGPVAPAFQNNYVSQYMPLPTEAINAAMQARQGQYDLADAERQELTSTAAGWQALPGDEELVTSLQAQTEEVAKSFDGQDLSRPEVRKALEDHAHSLTSNKSLLASQAAAKTYQDFQAQTKELTAKGKLHKSGYMLAQRKFQQYQKAGGAAAGAVLEPVTLSEELDAVSKADKYFSVLKESGGDSMGSLAAADGSMVYYENGSYGVDKSRIRGVAGEVLGDWLNSAEGQQVMQDGEVLGKDPIQYAAQFLYGRGDAHAYSKSTSGRAAAMNTAVERGLKKKEKDAEKQEAEATIARPWMSLSSGMDATPGFEADGSAERSYGIFESAAAGWSDPSVADNVLHQIGQSLHFGLTAAFGNMSDPQKTKEVLDHHVKAEASQLIEATALSNAVRAKQGLPKITEKDYFEANDKPESVQAPMLKDSKAIRAASDQLEGYVQHANLYNEKGEQLHGSDILSEMGEDAKVIISSDPNRSWATRFSPRSIAVTITNKDGGNGKSFIMDGGSHILNKEPTNQKEVDEWNNYQAEVIKSKKTAKFVEYEIKNKKLIKHYREGLYDASQSPYPITWEAE